MAFKYDGWDAAGSIFPFLALPMAIRRLIQNGSDLEKGFSKVFNGLTGETSAQATIEANERNIANQNYWNEVAMQREDTAHQREVADLQAAGLNPWLSAGGSGAGTASYSTAEAQPADGSKILQATTAMALLALSKGLSATTSANAKLATARIPKVIYRY